MRKYSPRGAGSRRAQDYLRELPDRAAADRYGDAVRVLADVPFLAEQFEVACAAAIFHCEKARTAKRLGFAEDKIDRRSWNTVNSAASKLKKALAELKGVGLLRLIDATRSTKARLGPTQAFQLLQALTDQRPKLFGRTGYVVGPIRISKPSRKRITPASALTICLAHMFDQVRQQKGLTLRAGSAITGGAAWEAAAGFVQAALHTDTDPSPAKKTLSENKGQIFYNGWNAVTIRRKN